MAQSAVELHRRSGDPGRIPPHNLEAEESLLGAMLLSRDAIAVAVETVKADDFYKPAHGHVFDAVLALYGSGEPVDPVTVAEELRRDGLLDVIGGKGALLQIQASTPASANAAHYAKIVEELALLRRLIGVAGEIAEMGYELPDDVTETLDRAESMVFEVAERRVSDTLVGVHDVLQTALDQLEALYGRDISVTGVPTGFADLDDLLLGFQPSALIVVAARPAMGKTSLALGAALNVAVNDQKPVLLFSLEMGHLELTQRLLAAEARVDSKKLRTGRLQDADWTRIAHAVGRLGEAPLFIDDNPHCSVMEMRAKARRIKAREGTLGLIVVDYLQLMSSPNTRESRQVEVSELSRGLKILARELEAPVLALSQLNRSPEYRQDKRPMLADLRESGCLTADTTIVRADTGATVTLGELLASGERDIPVWTVDDDLRVVRGTMTHVFPSGVKPVYRLRLRSGLDVKASPNHPFLTFDGWRRLDQLERGERLALPRRLPEPEHPERWRESEVVLLAHLLGAGELSDDRPLRYVSSDACHVNTVEWAAAALGEQCTRTRRGPFEELVLAPPLSACWSQRSALVDWLADLGVTPKGDGELTIPPSVWQLSRRQLATFVRHLWAAGGRVNFDGDLPAFSYLSASERFVGDLQRLLFRFGVISIRRAVEHPGGAVAHELRVVAERSRRRFVVEIGMPPATRPPGPGDGDGGETPPPLSPPQRTYRSAMGETYWGRTRGDETGQALIAALAADDDLTSGLVGSDLAWDTVEAIDYLGEMPVFDATVPGTHNFVADGIVVHNSIEQDADVVAFIYRDEVYNPESTDRGTAEIIVSKHRNGPTGTVRLAFLEHLTKFENMARVD